MKMEESHKKEEPLSAGDIFERYFDEVTDPEFPAFSFQRREQEVYFKYKAAHIRHMYSVAPASWSYYLSNRVKASHALVDHARVIKMLGSMRLELRGGCLHKVLRVFIANIYWFFYITIPIAMLFIFILGSLDNDWITKTHSEEGWSLLNVVLLLLTVLIVIRLCVETVQYFAQIKISTRLMYQSTGLFQYEETARFIKKYLYRQWAYYTLSYFGIILVMIILTWLTVPPGVLVLRLIFNMKAFWQYFY